MAQQYMTDSGVVLTIPGTYVAPEVISTQSGIPTTGVITLIGEADEGPDYTKESDLNTNAFTPDQLSNVIVKYGSGRLVDAFRAVISASSDPSIIGSVSVVKLVKTNPSVAATLTIARPGLGEYILLVARREGLPGNLIRCNSLTANPENAPTTGTFTYVPHYNTSPVVFYIICNGLSTSTVSVPQLTGSGIVDAITSTTDGILCTGGLSVLPLTGLHGVSISASTSSVSEQLIVTIAGEISGLTPGMTVMIPRSGDYGTTHDSAILGANGKNAGSYIVQEVTVSVSSSAITMKRINRPSGITSLESASGVVHTNEDDILSLTQLSISNITGMDRHVLTGMSGTVHTVVNGSQVMFTMPSSFTVQPVVGDYLVLHAAFAGVNPGFYQIIDSSINTITAIRLSNGSAGVNGSESVSETSFYVLRPVIDGLGKTMEFYGSVSSIFRHSTTLSPVAFGNSLLTSSSEYSCQFNINRGSTAEEYLIGGDIIATFGCKSLNARMIISANEIDFQINGVSKFKTSFTQYKTLLDLVNFVNTQPLFSASIIAPRYQYSPPSILDRGTFGLSSYMTQIKPARIKADANAFVNAINGSSLIQGALVTYSGLPEPFETERFLSGGSKAGTTAAQFIAAIDAVESVDTNLIVPLVSKDATFDIIDGLTDSTSTYTVDAINAYLKSHVLKMSAMEMRKNRIAIVSRSGSFSAQKDAAGQLSSHRVGMTFQDVKVVNGSGALVQYQPWMLAVIAAGMQAAAGYKGIVKKFANIFGALKPEGDFAIDSLGAKKEALKAGLLLIERVPTGGFRWVSDQLTYSVDNNFVYNSLQAIYITDLMILLMIDDFDRALVGKSVAEISAAGALSLLASEMFNFRRLRWIAPSDDAPLGYKNPSVVLNGGVMQINVEVKLAGLLYFIPINFAISQVTQTAS